MAEHEMTTPADIDRLLLGRETENLEFKHAANSFDFDELVKYCVALANEGGGRILFGVSDKPPRRVLGSLALRDPDTAFRIIQRIQLRVGIEEVQHPNGRVVVVSVPARPAGQPLHDRGRYLVRVGENVQPMLPEQMRRIFDEAVPDFSASVVPGASRFDLDEVAIQRFRELWARKSGRPELTEGPWAPILEDAELLQAGMPTVSCLVLLGSGRALDRFLPQAEIVHEYRDNPGDLTAAKRVEFRRPFILEFDEIWQSINAFNKEELLEDGFFKWPVPMLRERVVREAVLNVVAHRDYRSHASAFLRQTSTELSIVSPGGFPPSVTATNILTKSVPRNRRLAEALSRCGLVERAGSGADLMFATALSDGKALPDYSGTTSDEVSLRLRGQVQNKDFIRFLEAIRKERDLRFGVNDLLLLDSVARNQTLSSEQRQRADELAADGVLEAGGLGKKRRWMLAGRFYALTKRTGEYTRRKGLARGEHELLLLKHLERFGPSSMKDLQDVVPSSDRRSILKILNALKAAGKVLLEGAKRGAKWRISGQNELKSETKTKASASPLPIGRRQKSVKSHE